MERLSDYAEVLQAPSAVRQKKYTEALQAGGKLKPPAISSAFSFAFFVKSGFLCYQKRLFRKLFV